MATHESTLVIIKPDGVRRGLIGKVLTRYEDKGFRLTRSRIYTASRTQVETHYEEHKGKSFFKGLVDFLSSAPIMVLRVEGPCAIAQIRKINGASKVADREIGTIRGLYSCDLRHNVVHSSDSPEAAKRELTIWFP